MKDVVAALTVRTESNQRPTQEALEGAAEFARSHGLTVARVGRRHVTVRAEHGSLARALGVLPVIGGHVKIDPEFGDVAKHFSSVEIATVPLHF